MGIVTAVAVVVGVGATTTASATLPPDGERAVAEYQQALADTGFYRGAIDGLAGPMTRAAVLAFEKAAGLQRGGAWEPIHLRHLDAFEASQWRRDGEPDRVEIDLTNQVGYLVKDDQLAGVFGISSGNGETYEHPFGYVGVATTPPGDYRFQSHVDGVRQAPLGELYRPWYFHGGFALHGSPSVPAWPASHGCVRVEYWDADWLSDHLALGMAVHIWEGEAATPPPLAYEFPPWGARAILPT